jgi:NitT/TauT family transport system substrate-binding protein
MKEKLSVKVLALLSAIALAVSFAGCSQPANETNSGGQTNTELVTLNVIGTPDGQLSAQTTIAKELGYYEEEGVAVNLRYCTTLAEMNSLMAAANGPDIAFNSFYTVLTWMDGGMDLKIININNNMGGTQAAAIRKDFSLSSPADLKNATIGLVPGAEVNVVIRKMCEENGIDFDAIKIVTAEPPDQLSAFTTGDIDVIACWEPWITKAEALGGNFLLSGTKANIPGLSEDQSWLNLFSTTVARPSVLAEKPEAVGKFLKAIKKANDYINANPKDAAKILANAIDYDAGELEKIMTRNDYSVFGPTEVYKETFDTLQAFMIENDIIKKKFSFSQVNDFTIVKEVLPEIYELGDD